MSRSLFEFEVAVVGAGPAGLAAACAAAENGLRVGLVDETPWLGGQIWRGQSAAGVPEAPSRRRLNKEAGRWFHRFRNSGVMLLDSTSVIACPRSGVLLAEHEGCPREI